MLQPTAFAGAALVLTLLLPVAKFAQVKQPVPASKPSEIAYPTFEPFVSSRMFRVMVGDPATIDFKEKRVELVKLAEIQKTAKEAGEGVRGGKPEGPCALLKPEVDEVLRAALPLVPAAMIRLAPLWKSGDWSSEQLSAAKDVAEFLATLPEGPKAVFVEGKSAENHESLVRLVRWFRAEVSKPQMYAAMIATMDDGPFSGLPFETKEPMKPLQTQKLGAHVELRLCKVDRPKEPYVLQAVSNDKLLWSRVVSGGPDESVGKVELRSKPMKLDEYGWKVFLTVHWSQGEESAYMYLDAEGEMLFYFMSW